MGARASVVSSFTIIKGSLIEETYAVFRDWDFGLSKLENLKRVREQNTTGSTSTHYWARDVSKVLNRRYDPAGRDRPLVELAKAGCEREVWQPLLLYHMTRDEFLVRDFLINWLCPQFTTGAYRLHADDALLYLQALSKKKGIEWSGSWTEPTTKRVASGLPRIAADFGLLKGTQAKVFASYHLPERSFLYLLHAITDREVNARHAIDSEDWRMYLMDSADMELLRLHQFRKLHYEVAGSLAQIKLSATSAAEYAKELR
jgi:hypothetical protein